MWKKRRVAAHWNQVESLERRELMTADLAGNSMAAARAIKLGTTLAIYADAVGPADTTDYYKFTAATGARLTTTLRSLSADANLDLLNAHGTVIASSANKGVASESINSVLAAGTYYLRVTSAGASTAYALEVSAPAANLLLLAPSISLRLPSPPPTISSPTPPPNTSTPATPTPPASTTPWTITQTSMTSLVELDITGSAGNDTLLVTQSGNTLTITGNGHTSTVTGTFGDIAIHGGAGDDSITVDASVTLNCGVYGDAGNDTLTNNSRGRAVIVSIGGGSDTVASSNAAANLWVDSSDTVKGAGGSGVHVVSAFYQPLGSVPLDLTGQNLPDPIDAATEASRPNQSLWGTGPTITDIQQGSLGDCYLLSTLGGLAFSSPNTLTNLAVDLGDGTYAVQFKQNGQNVYVRVDGELPLGNWDGYAYAHPGPSGAIWAAIFEKAYALFSGSHTYAALNGGWMTTVFTDLGISNTSAPVSDPTLYARITAALASGHAVTAATNATVSGAPVIASHAYTIIGATKNSAGSVTYTLRNPWGIDGVADASNPSDGIITLTSAQLISNFSMAAWAV